MIDALSKLLAIDLSHVIDEKNKFFSFVENANQLRLLVETAQAAVDNQEYLSELPPNVRQNIETNLNSLVTTLEQIEANRDNREWMTAQYATQSERISQLYNELYEYFIRGVREYVNSLSATKKATQRTLAQLRRAAKETDETVQQAREATSELSTATLSEYFEHEAFKGRDLTDLAAKPWYT